MDMNDVLLIWVYLYCMGCYNGEFGDLGVNFILIKMKVGICKC